MCLFREPDAGNLPVRFDEREQETELRQTGLRRVTRKRPNSHRELKPCACSRLYSPLHLLTRIGSKNKTSLAPRNLGLEADLRQKVKVSLDPT
jgi:hypothetical protein